VSDPGPSGDPFEGIPFLGDLARMMQGQGPLNWEAARQVALSIASHGQVEPNVDPLERIRLEELARVADLNVAATTGLATSISGGVVTVTPVTRTQWAQRSLDAYKPLFERLAGALADEPEEPDEGDAGAQLLGGFMRMLAPMMLGMAAGSMVGHLAERSFGQYDLPVPRPPSDELLLVSPTIAEFGREWEVPDDDLRLWICIHEITHHAVLGIPHVRNRLSTLLNEYVSGFQPDTNALEHRLESLDVDPSQPDAMAELSRVLGDPEALLGVLQSQAQRDLLPRLEALLAVIAGYVDHVMDTVGGKLISSFHMLTEALRRRRVEAAAHDRFVGRLLGLEMTQQLYDRGEAFVQGVAERAGPAGVARLWTSERELPTPAEVDAPGLWLARIDLPDE
jgi:putative hydrolase